MHRSHLSVCLVLLGGMAGGYAVADAAMPVVSAIQASQRVGTTGAGTVVDITYDLEDVDSDSADITIEVSDDGGVTFDVPAATFTGDVGRVVMGAGKALAWQAGLDVPEVYWEECQVKVIANDVPMAELAISSTAFAPGTAIPVQYSCDGVDISPPLRWTGTPAGTQSFALILDDPDAPGGTFVHWVLYNMPAATDSLGEGASPSGALPAGSLEGITDFGIQSYGGPCPPPGPAHRYYFRLYALDTVLALPAGATRDQLDLAMAGHILAQAELMGLFAQ